MRWSMIALMSLGLVVNGCGGATDAASVCDPGESQSCSCTLEGVSTPGERICRQGGAEWTECHCDASDASGSGEGTPSSDVSGPGSGSSDITAPPGDATPSTPDPAPDTTDPGEPDTTDPGEPDATDPGDPDAGDPDATDAGDTDATEEPDTTVCVPDCAGKTCGGDGCGGTCGTCEAGWTCEAGACQAPPPCTSDDDCAAISAAEACWTYTCDPTDGCVADLFLEGTSCDDGDPCTFGAFCAVDEFDQEICLGTPVPVDDGNDCTVDACVDGVITHSATPDGLACDYSTTDCTSGDSCVEGECVAGTPLEIDDDNPCTEDACIQGELVHTALLEGQCDDGDECTTDESCVDGTCTGGEVVECAVGPCVADAVCVSGEGCVASLVPEDTPCDADDNVCTVDTCDDDGLCQATGELDSCQAESANGPCWTWVCNPDAGCMTAGFTEGGACNDNDACTHSDICTVDASAQAVCAGQPLPVDDGNPCTDDACVDGEVTHNGITGAFCPAVQGCGGVGFCLGGICLATDSCDCGDGTCGAGEDCENCEVDCGACSCASFEVVDCVGGCTLDAWLGDGDCDDPELNCAEWNWDLGDCDTCDPACAGKECGPDGCGGSCGSCAVGAPCNASGLCPG